MYLLRNCARRRGQPGPALRVRRRPQGGGGRDPAVRHDVDNNAPGRVIVPSRRTGRWCTGPWFFGLFFGARPLCALWRALIPAVCTAGAVRGAGTFLLIIGGPALMWFYRAKMGGLEFGGGIKSWCGGATRLKWGSLSFLPPSFVEVRGSFPSTLVTQFPRRLCKAFPSNTTTRQPNKMPKELTKGDSHCLDLQAREQVKQARGAPGLFHLPMTWSCCFRVAALLTCCVAFQGGLRALEPFPFLRLPTEIRLHTYIPTSPYPQT